MTDTLDRLNTSGAESPPLDERQKRLILISMCAALVAVVASVSGLNVAQQDLAADLGATQGQVLWVINAYTLALAGLAELQHRLGIGIEQEVQQLLDSTAVLFAANVYYLVHFPLTVFVLGMAFARSRQRVFRVLRNGLVAATGCAVVVHWAIPLAPPRMLPGYVDAAALVGPDPYRIPGSEGANQFAAMPSMHVAWAILVGWACWSMTGRRGLRLAAVAHPIVTCVVVVVTGHHFITDVAVGAFLAAGALVVLGVGRSVRAQPVAPSEVLSEVLAEPAAPASRVAGNRREHRRSRCHGRSTTRLPVLVSRPSDLASSAHARSLTDGDRVKERERERERERGSRSTSAAPVRPPPLERPTVRSTSSTSQLGRPPCSGTTQG